MDFQSEQNQPFKERPSEAGKVFHYKMVAKSMGKFLSIYDGKTEYVIGQTLYQEAWDRHKGGYYVYPSVEQVIFADIPYKPGGLYIAPRTILKCICWGKCVEYDNGKMAFSYICPVEDLGIPQGYKSSKTALRETVKRFEEKQKAAAQKRPKKPQTAIAHAFKPGRRPHSAYRI